jgi:hypothetical protein
MEVYMRRKKQSQLLIQYRYENDTNTYLIDVALDDYDDVYDDWDPAPFKRRFIQEEFDYFIVSSAEDIPFKYNVSIVLYLPEQKMDKNKEIAVESAYRNYYSYELGKINKSRIRVSKKSLYYFLLSMFFLTLGYFLHYDENFVFNILKEGVIIGGWVFLWEFFTNLFIILRDLSLKYKAYRRLYESEIRFIYTK